MLQRESPRTIGTVLAIITILLIPYSCSDNSSAPGVPEIISISPTTGPPGITVTIAGTGFSETSSENKVTFNGVLGDVTSASTSSIEATVPQKAQSGAVSVMVGGQTAVGPNFTVEEEMPGITAVEPDSGAVGTLVTITGMNFSSTASENIVTFNGGVIAEVQQASSTELITQVPEGAESGPIEVEVVDQKTISPLFDVITTGTLAATITTTGPNPDDYDPDGYTLRIDGLGKEATEIDDVVHVTGLQEGIHEIETADFANNCTVETENPQNFGINAGDTTEVSVEVHCDEKKRQVVFSSNRDGFFNIYTIDAECCETAIQLTDGRRNDTNPIVSPDASQIAFIRSSGGSEELFLINSDGNGSPTQLTDVSIFLNSTPVWSPDGNQIAYVDGTQIYTIKIDGSEPRVPLTDSTGTEVQMVWSPDGSQIAYAASYTGEDGIYLMNADGSGTPTQLVAGGLAPNWSSDGSQIVYVGSDGDGEIFIIDANGASPPTQLTDNTLIDELPKWSPDGTKIAYLSTNGSDFALNIIDANGTPLTQAAISANNPKFNWSPDSSQLVYVGSDTNDEEILLLDADGTGGEQLSNNIFDDVDPVWGGLY